MDFSDAAAHCPHCGAEYRAGFDTCADDGTPLVAGPAPETGPWNTPEPEEEPAPAPAFVAPAGTAVVCNLPYEEAYLMAGRLEAEGIPAAVDPPAYASAYPPGILHHGFDVVVPRDRHHEAVEIARAVGGVD